MKFERNRLKFIMKVHKQIFLFLLASFFCKNLRAQQLNADETINYINKQAVKYNVFTSQYEQFDSLTIHISETGYITIGTCFHEFSWEKDTGSIFGTKANRLYTWHDHFKFDYRTVQVEKSAQVIAFVSRSTPIQESDGTTNFKNLSLQFDIEGIDKILNALDYLFSILKYDERYNKIDNDPFSKNNYQKTKGNFANNSLKSQNISLISDNGLYKIKVSICGVLVEMILDSGASDVSISSDIEKKLTEKSIIKKTSYLTPGLYKLADGTIVTNKRLIVPYVKIGSFTIKNVVCSVSPSNEALLVGKSLLNQFGKWSIDNNNQILVLEK